MKLATTILAFAPLLLAPLVQATLLVNYSGGDAAKVLGNVELEGSELGCKITNGKAGNACFIKPEADSLTGRPSLHFKRDPYFRRAEVKSLAAGHQYQAVENKTYHIGYEFRLSAVRESLVIFQWKKWDKEIEPKQNIPLYVFFNAQNELVIEYTIPGSNGSNRSIVWTGPLDPSAATKLAFTINTANDGTGWFEFYVNGVKQTFNQAWGGTQRLQNVYLFTGPTSPKFGIYRGEKQGGDPAVFCPADFTYTGPQANATEDRIFNSWIYRVQISDGSIQEIAEAGGVGY
ncbi:hypothetical protein DFH27DRAFT_360502 [Peziza echinospora]|nr:hypothetical protein DFH27DRAFT_360502 [Peziza echinospora]